MMSANRKVLAAVVAPILALLMLTAYKHFILNSGLEITLPISGYDPRDLLSGHYLIYRVDYGVDGICAPALDAVTAPETGDTRAGFVCLTDKTFSQSEPEACVTYIRGTCNYGRFEAGIERFYIPEAQAPQLDKDVRERKASIVLSVTSNGTAQVKELLIDGRPWKR